MTVQPVPPPPLVVSKAALSRSPAPTGPLPSPRRTRPPRLRRPRHPDSRPRQHTTSPGSRPRSGNSSENSSDSPVALVDHARVERPGLDQVQSNVFGDRRQVRRAAADDDRMAEHAQLVDEAELEGLRGQAGAAERAAEDGLRERAPGVGERGPELVVAHRRVRLPPQHRLVEPAAEQVAAELSNLREVETKELVAGGPP